MMQASRFRARTFPLAPVPRASDLAAYRSDLAALRFKLALIRYELLRRKAGFNPDQPRVPDGNPDGGQWTILDNNECVVQSQSSTIAARQRRGLQALCDAQYDRDVFQCRMVGLSACYAQAALRYANCLAGLPIPPLNY